MKLTMSPRQIRQSWNPDITIFDICLALHMENNGSSDPLPDNVRRDYLDNLELTMEQWMPSFPGSRKFDDAIKDLIYATLIESGHVKEI